jgi:hypothetical protein
MQDLGQVEIELDEHVSPKNRPHTVSAVEIQAELDPGQIARQAVEVGNRLKVYPSSEPTAVEFETPDECAQIQLS